MRGLQNSKPPQASNSQELKFQAPYGCMEGRWALSHPFPSVWPTVHPRKALRTGVEMPFVAFPADPVTLRILLGAGRASCVEFREHLRQCLAALTLQSANDLLELGVRSV